MSPIAGFVSSASMSCRKCTLPDASPATIVRPSNETAQEVVRPSAVSKASSFPLSRSQTRSVLSSDAETARRPSGVMATPFTERLWPSSVRRLWPLSGSQTRSVLSSDAETARRPSGVMVTPPLPFPAGCRYPSPMPTTEPQREQSNARSVSG